MKKNITFIINLNLIIFLSCNNNFEPFKFNSYPPEIIKDDKYFIIQIPAEIDKKENKNPFSVILQRYGFSGNGASIEQIIKYNIKYNKVNYNSEGGSFRAEFKNKQDLDEYYLLIKPVLDEGMLHKWTFNARHILIKE